jgi:hypothetical protein
MHGMAASRADSDETQGQPALRLALPRNLGAANLGSATHQFGLAASISSGLLRPSVPVVAPIGSRRLVVLRRKPIAAREAALTQTQRCSARA